MFTSEEVFLRNHAHPRAGFQISKSEAQNEELRTSNTSEGMLNASICCCTITFMLVLWGYYCHTADADIPVELNPVYGMGLSVAQPNPLHHLEHKPMTPQPFSMCATYVNETYHDADPATEVLATHTDEYDYVPIPVVD